MAHRVSIALVLIVTVLLPCDQSLRSAPREVQHAKSAIKCRDVVESVFRFPARTSPDSRYFQRRIVVRYLPSWGAESQILLEDKSDGSITAVNYTVKQGTPSISEQCERVLKANPNASVEDVVRTLSIEQKVKAGQDSISRLFREFFQYSIETDLDSAFTADGTTYELWVQTVSNEIHLTLSDGAYGDRTVTTPIFKWIMALRAEANRSKR